MLTSVLSVALPRTSSLKVNSGLKCVYRYSANAAMSLVNCHAAPTPSMRMPFAFPLQGPELSSDDRRGRNAALLELDAIVDTARRAGSSVGDPVDHHLALASRRLEHLVGHRKRGSLLVVADGPGHAVRAPAQLLDAIQERAGTGLRIVEETDDSTLERGNAAWPTARRSQRPHLPERAIRSSPYPLPSYRRASNCAGVGSFSPLNSKVFPDGSVKNMIACS